MPDRIYTRAYVDNSYNVKTLRVVAMRREDNAQSPLNFSRGVYDGKITAALADLMLITYFGDNGVAYGLELRYHGVHSITAHNCAIMARTIAKVQKAIDATASRDPGDVYMAFATAIRASGHVMLRRDNGSTRYSDNEWRFADLSAGRDEVRRLAQPDTAAVAA